MKQILEFFLAFKNEVKTKQKKKMKPFVTHFPDVVKLTKEKTESLERISRSRQEFVGQVLVEDAEKLRIFDRRACEIYNKCSNKVRLSEGEREIMTVLNLKLLAGFKIDMPLCQYDRSHLVEPFISNTKGLSYYRCTVCKNKAGKCLKLGDFDIKNLPVIHASQILTKTKEESFGIAFVKAYTLCTVLLIIVFSIFILI